ncbi:MAG: 50S ribosomal protein L4 [Roseibacillus sp.]|nr:50S ribosomal protein L4 [Roseibacillus sp.]|tara:strand:- start:2796 stop:3407 length:612 start_codon:yes stop_codon:yes gene_type:complete
MSATTLTLEEAKAASITVLEDREKGNQAVHDLIVAYQANRRSGSANTKTRGEIRGTGKKMYRQKGTGNARHRTSKVPLYVGGGVAHGPRPRDYSKQVPKKIRKLAFRRVLGDCIADGKIQVVDSFEISDGKTKSFLAEVGKITEAEKVLVIAPEFDDKTLLSHRNVPGAMCLPAIEVSIEELLYHDSIIVTAPALEVLASRTS